jgi:very-short-patch-repair endonuclease
VEQFNGKEANQRLQALHRESTEIQHEGYRVMLFWNNDVMNKTEAVMEAIHDATAVTPPRLPVAGDPPPQGEGGK